MDVLDVFTLSLLMEGVLLGPVDFALDVRALVLADLLLENSGDFLVVLDDVLPFFLSNGVARAGSQDLVAVL